MKTLWNLAILPAAALFALPAQERTDERVRELAPVDPSEQAPDQQDRHLAPGFDAAAWEQGLASTSLEERERTYQDILRAARRDERARRTLREWADDASHVDRAWNARLALRELSLSQDPCSSFTNPGAPGRGMGRSSMPFADPFGSGFPDTSRLFEDMQRQLDDLLQRGSGAQPFGAQPPGGASRSESFRLESGPDGVKVHVRELVDGQEQEKTYEAESLEDLLEAYPELQDRIQLSPGLSGDTRERLEDMLGRMQGAPFDSSTDPFGRTPTGPVPTDRLGVLMREPGSYGASVEGVEAGVGLLVERVLPHTIASELGLQPGDILIELNGRKLSSAEDVRGTLAARKADEPVVLKLVDALGQQRSTTWEPDATQAPTAPVPLKRQL